MTRVVTRFLVSVIALFIAAAVGCTVYIFMTREDKISTVEVSLVSVDVGIDADATVVRTEIPITKDAGLGYFALIDSGERVSAGQDIIAVFDSNEKALAYERLQKILLKAKILAEFTSGNGSNDLVRYNGEIFSALTDSAKVVSGHSGISVSDVRDSIENALLRKEYSSYDKEALDGAVARIAQERALLTDLVGYGEPNYLTAEASGFYVSAADGWEKLLTPQRLLELSYEDYAELLEFSPESFSADNCCGKITVGNDWYLAATVRADDAIYLDKGAEYTVSIGGGSVKMSLVSISGSEDGTMALAVFSAGTPLSDITQSRFKVATIVFDRYEGFRIPSEGIHVVDGRSGVYVLEGARAVFKEVDILYNGGSFYIVKADYENRGNLFNGDKVIIGQKDLYDGKMMK